MSLKFTITADLHHSIRKWHDLVRVIPGCLVPDIGGWLIPGAGVRKLGIRPPDGIAARTLA
jgi:hypothetical protein